MPLSYNRTTLSELALTVFVASHARHYAYVTVTVLLGERRVRCLTQLPISVNMMSPAAQDFSVCHFVVSINANGTIAYAEHTLSGCLMLPFSSLRKYTRVEMWTLSLSKPTSS